MSTINNPPSAAADAKTASLRDELNSLRIDRSRGRQSSWLAGVLWALLGLGLLGSAGGAGYWALKDRLFPLPVVKVESVRVMTLGQARTELTATGYLESRWQAAVGAKVPGRIANIPVEEGSQVKEGDVLAELEHSDLDAMLASRQVAVTVAEAQLAEAGFNLTQAKRDYQREKNLFNRKAGTESEAEKAEMAQQAAEAILQARTASVAAAKSAVVEANEAVRNMFIYAPFDGTVVSKDAEVGESIMPGGMGASSGRGSVITLAKLDQLEVDTDVKEDYLGQIHKGQPTEVVVDAAPDRRYRGRLREIIPMGDRTRGIVKVKVSVLDPDERLFPELSATVHFLPDAADDDAANPTEKKGVFVPTSAIQEIDGKTYVWRLAGDRVNKTAITTVGEPHDGLIAVTDALVGGDLVIVDPPPGLKEGEQVKPAE